MDLAAWLSSLGLGQYSSVFHENDIDFEVLAAIDDADLERLGLSLGHRRKLLKAIAERRSANSDTQQAERRQVTVMFCDLVGSTQLAARLDPEDMGDIIRRFQNAAAGAIARYNGFVARFMGDGVLAYFGFPQANEDAAEHAVRAGLGLIADIARIPRSDGSVLQARVGIATGTVMIGDVAAAGTYTEFDVVGDTPNLAARLQALAAPGSVLISSGTRQLLGERFAYQDAGEHELKGFPNRMRVWRVAGEAVTDSRFAATRAKSSRFVGRDAELGALLGSWRDAVDARGRAVLISGEPGLGKSRLVEAFLDHEVGTPRRVIKCQCSPYHANSALHPVIRNIERAVGFDAADSEDKRLDALEGYLRGVVPEQEDAPALFADLLGLPVDRYAACTLTPMQRKTATLETLTAVILGLSRSAPVLLILEDAHWADPTTLELWTRKVDRIRDASVLLLVTARPEFQSPWRDRANASQIHLVPMPREECARLAAAVAAPDVLAEEIVRDIVAKSDGVPLYVEELTKATREAMSAHVAVPATLHDSLMALLDRVGAAKSLAQVAAVIGQQFTRSLLAAVTELASSRLDAELERLAEAALIVKLNRTPEPTFTFRHALLRDIAYENLLRPRRQQLHERIARTIAEGFPAIAEHEPEVLAHHYGQAGKHGLAATWFERAGDRAALRSSFVEAHAHFEASFAAAARIEDGEARTRRELEVLLKDGPALVLLRGPQHPSVGEVYARAHERAEKVGDEEARFKSTWGLWFNAMVGRRLEVAKARANELVRVATAMEKEDLLLEGLHCRWSTAMFRGEVEESLAASADGMQRYDRAKHQWMGPIFGGHDPGVCAFAVQSINLALRGRGPEALAAGNRAIELAGELNHPNSMCHALQNMTFVVRLLGDDAGLERLSHRMLEMAERYNFPPQRAHAKFMIAWLRARRGELDVDSMVQDFSKAIVMGPMYRYYAALLAEICVESGHYDLALQTLEAAIASVAEPGVGFFVPELHRVKGVCLERRRPGDPDARRCMETAVAVARQQGATLFERGALRDLESLAAS